MREASQGLLPRSCVLDAFFGAGEKKAAAAAGADLGPVFTRGRAHSSPPPRAHNAVLRCCGHCGS
jgi:hypothetical protein